MLKLGCLLRSGYFSRPGCAAGTEFGIEEIKERTDKKISGEIPEIASMWRAECIV